MAGSVPGWTNVSDENAYYQSRYLSIAGRLFFDSPVGLVPADANGRQDVVRVRAPGPGSGNGALRALGHRCRSGFQGRPFLRIRRRKGEEGAGCLGLISSGTSGEESAFLDASGMGPGGQEGEDVFFLTAAKLSPSDTDTALDVYDAHICSTARRVPPRR